MKKFSLQRAMSFGAAVVMTVSLSGCNHNLNNTPSAEPTGVIAVTDAPDVEVTSNQLEIDSSLPIIVSIEEVVMPNGDIGYKMPLGYMPYWIDRTKPFPREVAVLESGEDYVIYSGVHITYTDGTPGYLGYDGSVAIYQPYYNYLVLLNDHKSSFYNRYYEAKESYGDDSSICEMYRTVVGLEEAAKDVYYSNHDRGSR